MKTWNKLSDKAVNKNSTRSTKNWISTYNEWALIRRKNPKLEEYVANKTEMDKILGCFFGELRKKDGKNY